MLLSIVLDSYKCANKYIMYYQVVDDCLMI